MQLQFKPSKEQREKEKEEERHRGKDGWGERYLFSPSSILIGHLYPPSSTSSLYPLSCYPPSATSTHYPTPLPRFNPPSSFGATLCLPSSFYLLLLAYPSTLSFFHPTRVPLLSFFHLARVPQLSSSLYPFSCYPPSPTSTHLSTPLPSFRPSFSHSSCFAFTSRILGENN